MFASRENRTTLHVLNMHGRKIIIGGVAYLNPKQSWCLLFE